MLPSGTADVNSTHSLSFVRLTCHLIKHPKSRISHMDGPIASAVVLPEETLPTASPTNGNHKRRQSSVDGETSKRPRLDEEEATNGRRGSTEVKPVRRERGRERRLFGAVLGALSQAPSTTAAQKRRSEIEKRQLAQRKQESEESEQRKAERVARRKVQRWREQKRFEEASVGSLPRISQHTTDRHTDATAARQSTEHGSLPPD